MPAARQLAHDMAPFLDAVSRNEHLDGPSHGLVGAVPVQPLGASVPGADRPVEALAEDRVHRAFNDGGEMPGTRGPGPAAGGSAVARPRPRPPLPPALLWE